MTSTHRCLDAYESSLLASMLEDLKKGKPICIPKYDFVTQSRSVSLSDEVACQHTSSCLRVPNEHAVVESADVVLVEGILIFFEQPLRDMFDLKLFVDADPDIRLARRGSAINTYFTDIHITRVQSREIRPRGRGLFSKHSISISSWLSLPSKSSAFRRRSTPMS